MNRQIVESGSGKIRNPASQKSGAGDSTIELFRTVQSASMGTLQH